jgi:hypothetical protein
MGKPNGKKKRTCAITCAASAGAALLAIAGLFFYVWEFVLGTRIPGFRTKLAAEEHIASITKRTEERYAEELSSGAITAFQVYTLWSFKDKPEYFLVEFDGDYSRRDGFLPPAAEGQGDGQEDGYTGHAYLIGYISNDEYYTYVGYPAGAKSPFREQGLESEKKYYGFNTMAVKREREMICVDSEFSKSDKHWTETGAVLSKSKRNWLATHDYRLPSVTY